MGFFYGVFADRVPAVCGETLAQMLQGRTRRPLAKIIRPDPDNGDYPWLSVNRPVRLIVAISTRSGNGSVASSPPHTWV